MENSTKVSATVAEQEAQNAKNEKIRKYVTWGDPQKRRSKA